MEEYIQISKINDFIFCPRSLYFHSLFENFDEKTYHSTYQVEGKIKHESVEKGTYSTRKNVIQAIEIYSDKYQIAGKIDIYDSDKKELIERKNKISKIYLGYIYQLYAQMFCLQEMGFEVKFLTLYSMKDNKVYNIDLPSKKDIQEFEDTLTKMKKFNILTDKIMINEEKCKMCVYKSLCR